MEIHFLKKEEKENKVDINNITFCYLMAICNKNPELWEDFKLILKMVEEKCKET